MVVVVMVVAANSWLVDYTTVYCVSELNAQFEDMLRRNEDVVKAAISSVNLQTSQLPMDAE